MNYDFSLVAFLRNHAKKHRPIADWSCKVCNSLNELENMWIWKKNESNKKTTDIGIA